MRITTMKPKKVTTPRQQRSPTCSRRFDCRKRCGSRSAHKTNGPRTSA
jgi:hypothetical protein